MYVSIILFRPPPTDPLKDPTKTPAAGFGGALTAALDVMAFTHDIEVAPNPQTNTVNAQFTI